MRKHHKRFAIRFLISAFVAVTTPALAAGVVVGVSAAATTVADVTQPAIDTQTSSSAGVNGRVATHGPARLSVLVGNGDMPQNTGAVSTAPAASP